MELFEEMEIFFIKIVLVLWIYKFVKCTLKMMHFNVCKLFQNH